MSRARKGRNGDYEVGFGRTPVATRFKPGESGNPKGRPKKAKAIGRILQDVFHRRVKIQENGRSRTRDLVEVMLHNLGNDAARRDLKALKALFALARLYADSPETTLDPTDLKPEDEAIIREYMAKLASESGVAPDNPGNETEGEERGDKPK
jgi:hypothetical protein